MISSVNTYIKEVIIYKGHELNSLLGPYSDSIIKVLAMFRELNAYRGEISKPMWRITTVSGENLITILQRCNRKETLLVIPAGQSTHLDSVFSIHETDFLQKEFFMKGGRGYFTCGSAYWISEKRIYKDLCTEQPKEAKTLVKISKLPLFQGTAEGPLCPYPGEQYQVGFFSNAVRVMSGRESCTVYLSGGAVSFLGKMEIKQPVYLSNMHTWSCNVLE